MNDIFSELALKLRKIIALLLALFGIGIPMPIEEPTQEPSNAIVEEIDGNLLSRENSTFESKPPLQNTLWETFGGGNLAYAEGKNGGVALRLSERAETWHSPAVNIFDIIKENGTGVYVLGASVFFESNSQEAFICGQVLRGTKKNSFITSEESFFRMKYFSSPKANSWLETQVTLTVTENDITQPDKWLFCFDLLTPDVNAIRVDNVYIKKAAELETYSEEIIPTESETFCSTDMLLFSNTTYENPLFDNETRIVLTHTDGTTLDVPGFWDGENIWRFRFALTKEGTWSYKTMCSDENNSSLMRQGTIECKKYTGELPLYRHGFVDIKEGNRFFTYADGTPFFYLGDTHWTMPTEEFYSKGENACEIETDSHFKHIVKSRANQGFTVYQSEPIDASYFLSDGLDNNDIEGFRDLDRRFAYIAECGLVHANSQLFYVSELSDKPEAYSKEYIEKLARYWVARYSAFPVLWTTAQESDNDYYFSRGDQSTFNAQNNPWKTVLESVHKYDAYNHPGSAHMEYSTFEDNGTVASTSSFREVNGHNWYAVQWSPSLKDNGNNFDISKDYWTNGQNKVIINYEGRYENLWTKNFGARAQGWISYLSGMYGYGYGCEDMWYYKSSYDILTSSHDGIDKISAADKSVKWGEMLNTPTVSQLKFMRDFLEKNQWNELVPRFDDGKWVCFGPLCAGVAASKGNEIYVAYFYGKSTSLSTTLKGLDCCTYIKQWFNPRTGEYKKPKNITPVCGKLHIVSKPDKNDWVLLVTKK